MRSKYKNLVLIISEISTKNINNNQSINIAILRMNLEYQEGHDAKLPVFRTGRNQ